MSLFRSGLVASTILASSVIMLAPAMARAGQPAAEKDSTVTEVVVTAQKTVENVQTVPIAVTAVTAKALETKGIHDIAALSALAPNVTLDAGTPFSGSDNVLSAYIRGIGQNDFAFNQDPGVGVYIDGVYLARSVGANTNMLDVERVEILKGPQGTLFGRNTIGGAISIVTRDPGSEYTGKLEVTTGSYNRFDVRGSVDLPLSDKIRTSLAFSELKRDGWQKVVPYTATNLAPGSTSAGSVVPPLSYIPDCGPVGATCSFVEDPNTAFPAAGYKTSSRAGGQNQWSLRGKVLLLPTDNLKITIAADYTHVDQEATANSLLQVSTGDPSTLGFLYNLCISGLGPPNVVGSPCGPRGGLSPTPTPFNTLPGLGGVNSDGDPTNNRLPFDERFITHNPNLTYGNGNNFSKLENWGVAVTGEWKINSDTTLKSITAYRSLHWQSGIDADGSPLNIFSLSFDMPQTQISEELQLIGKGFDDRLSYVLGAYYFSESGHLHDLVTFPEGLLQIDGPNDLKTQSGAVFAHLNFKLTDQLSITAGGRYTVEHKTFEGHQSDDNGIAYRGSPTVPTCFVPGALASSYGITQNLDGSPLGATETCQQFLGFPSASEPYRYFPPGVNTLNFNNFSPTVALEYRPSQDVMLYASYSEGFKTGSWTTRLSIPHPTYDASLHFGPEHAKTEEIGVKSELLEHRLRVNLAGFHTDYSGIQLNEQIGLSPTLVNAGDATIWGAELETDAVLGHGFSVSGSVGYTNAKYTHINPGVADGGVVITTAMKLPKTPEWKFNIGPQYLTDVPGGGQLQFNLDYTYTSELFNNLANDQVLKRPATNIVSASVTYKAPGDKWEVVVGGNNLTNDRYLVTGQSQPAIAEFYGTYSDPAEWYATLRLHF